MKLAIFMANGCEEIEALTVVDIARRAGLEIDTVSVAGDSFVTGSHNIRFECDIVKEEMYTDEYDGVILPGGMPGTKNLGMDATVTRTVTMFAATGKLVAAICAAPSVLGQCGVLKGKEATSYPGFEDKLTGAKVRTDLPVVKDGNIITSRGMGTAIEFALAIVEYCCGKEQSDKIAEGIIYR